MRCPTCGHENNDLATRCSACGSELQGAGFWSQPTNPTAEESSQAQDEATFAQDAPRRSRRYVTKPTPAPQDAPKPSAKHMAADDEQEDTARRPFVTATADEQEDTARRPFVTATADEQAPTAAVTDEEDAPQPAAAGDNAAPHMTPPVAPQLKRDPQSRDAAGAAGRPAASKHKRMSEFLRKHQRALGIGIALVVVAIMGAVWLVTTLTNAPSHAQIADDVAARIPSYSYAGGVFGPDLEIPLSHTNVSSCTATQAPEGMEVSDGVGSAAFDVAVELTYDDGRLHVVRNVSTIYVRANEGWVIGGELIDQSTSLTPLSGVDESKVLTNMEPILSSADGVGHDTLSQIYAEGEFNIVGHDFQENAEQSATVDQVVVHCVSNADFYSYEGNITAQFVFESGEWRLQSAIADEAAATRSYAPLLGEWSGTMVSHTADAGSCFGARNKSLVLTIDSLGETIDNQARVEGTFSGIAHFHAMLTSDRTSSRGDEYLQSAPFTGVIMVEQGLDGNTLSLKGTVTTSSSTGSSTGTTTGTSTRTTTGTTTGTSTGTTSEVSFDIEFGTDDDPSAAVARVTTNYESEELMLMIIPRKATTRFVDTYLIKHTDMQSADQ